MASFGRSAIAALAALAACGDANAPVRQAAYDFRGLDADGSLVTFRWPAERLPVRYYVVPAAGPVTRYLERALVAWEGQFLYGEFRGALVADSASADVVVFVPFGTPPDVPLTNDPPDIQACTGRTDIFYSAESMTIDGQMLMDLRWTPGRDSTNVANCLARVVIHEVGHSLGLLAHSANADDLMAVAPTAREPTVNDRITAQVLYHTRSDLRPAERAP